ncbi:MAG TPA: tRNA dihydrouridine(20/20a) synthase DusA [Caulobacteraceae bacterium]|nr:tRNA dihydrouridine(20/20a) synthase DusA [Caulobacteraceae bacterium]
MMDWTDRHCRRLHRGLTRRARLYTEMLTAQAVLRGDRARLLAHDTADGPVALQLGGAEPALLAEAARIGEGFGYDEINLNVGCPSDRVQSGRFGACLMREPDLVADCMAAIGAAVSIPATVKCRIGVDEQDPDESLFGLVDRCAAAGVSTFIIHARKAWLDGLSPKENRDLPPLDYGLVYRLKAERPHLTVAINGGVGSLDEAAAHLAHVDGVMLGRLAYHQPGVLGQADRGLFDPDAADVDAVEAVARYRPHVAAELAAGVGLHALIRPLLGLFHGAPGARAWRRILTVESTRSGAGLDVLDRALDAVREAAARRLELA